MSAASQARRRRVPDDLEIVAFEKGGYTSYSACGIPYFIGGVVDEVASLIVRQPRVFREEQAIDARIGHEVLEIDLDKPRDPGSFHARRHRDMGGLRRSVDRYGWHPTPTGPRERDGSGHLRGANLGRRTKGASLPRRQKAEAGGDRWRRLHRSRDGRSFDL